MELKIRVCLNTISSQMKGVIGKSTRLGSGGGYNWVQGVVIGPKPKYWVQGVVIGPKPKYWVQGVVIGPKPK